MSNKTEEGVREAIGITCNGGYCEYRFQSNCFWGCKYSGYCDYQCPKDSRFTQSHLGEGEVTTGEIYKVIIEKAKKEYIKDKKTIHLIFDSKTAGDLAIALSKEFEIRSK